MARKRWGMVFLCAVLVAAMGGMSLSFAAPSPPSEKPGWPWSSPGGGPYDVFIADVDYDGDLEVVSTAFESPSYWLYVWNHDGTVLTNFPVEGTIGSWPVSLADVDGNGTLEIIVIGAGASGWGNELICYRSGGTTLWTKTASCCFRAFRTPAIADVDLDGTLDVFAIAAPTSGSDQAWLLHGATGTNFVGWPQFLTGYGRDQQIAQWAKKLTQKPYRVGRKTC